MRILGIDPGLNVTGYGLLQADGRRLHYRDSGTIRVPKGPPPERLKVLFESVHQVARDAQADVAVVEVVFVNVNPQSTLLLGQARGAVIAALVAAGLPVAEYTALQLKKSVVGWGRASKSQVQDMVMRLLELPGLPGPDAADALGLAICHAHTHRGAAMIGRAAEAAGHAPAASPRAGGSSLPAAALRTMQVRRGRLV